MPKLCDFETCRKQASYGEFYGKPIRCKEHKGEYRLVIRLCREGNCKKIPVYNFEGETKSLYCSTHKMDGMINVATNSCIHFGCKTRPSYNKEGETKSIILFRTQKRWND